jgi:tRNA dimethylallyltransferase
MIRYDHEKAASSAPYPIGKNLKSVIVAGPTAIGKTACAIEIAQRFGGEIISADSMQVYKGMDVGTAKPSAKELASAPHHLIGVIDPKSEDYSVAVWHTLADAAIKDICDKQKLPIIAGGTGLYIHSLIYELDFSGSGGDASLRAHYESLAENFGNSYIYDILL